MFWQLDREATRKKGKEAAKKSSSHMAYCLQDLSHCGRKSQTAAHFSCFVFFFFICARGRTDVLAQVRHTPGVVVGAG